MKEIIKDTVNKAATVGYREALKDVNEKLNLTIYQQKIVSELFIKSQKVTIHI